MNIIDDYVCIESLSDWEVRSLSQTGTETPARTMSTMSSLSSPQSPLSPIKKNFFYNPFKINKMIERGNLDLIMYHRMANPFLFVNGVDIAAKYQHLHLVQYFHSQGIQCTINAFLHACTHNNHDMIQFLCTHYTDVLKKNIDILLQSKHYVILQYLPTT